MNPLHLFYITNIRIMQDITNGRCGWCGTDELYMKYHDQEWGKLVTDDKTLFEFLVLESAQAGLSWITILRKREGYRKAFYNFDAELVAQMTDEDIERLMQFEGIVKKRGFKFFGTTICYAHLQASGFINDHLTDCICRKVPQ